MAHSRACSRELRATSARLRRDSQISIAKATALLLRLGRIPKPAKTCSYLGVASVAGADATLQKPFAIVESLMAVLKKDG